MPGEVDSFKSILLRIRCSSYTPNFK